MANRFLGLFLGPRKPRRTNNEFNQSMIDFIAEDAGMSDSFRSVQPHLETSFSMNEHQIHAATELGSPSLQDFTSVGRPKANISSVFNTPKRVFLYNYIILK